MTTRFDPLEQEQRDSWRALWQFITSAPLLAFVAVIVAVGLVGMALLPQIPGTGVSDPVSYSRWEADARLREGAFYDFITGLGLNAVQQAPWWRVAVGVLGVLAVLKLIEHLAGFLAARKIRADPSPMPASIADARRVRVAFDAPPLAHIADSLVRARFQIARLSPSTLLADRWPWANVLAALLPLGLFLVSIGLIANLSLGWDVSNRAVLPDLPATLPNGTRIAMGAPQRETSGAVSLSAQSNMPTPDQSTAFVEGQQTQLGGVHVRLRQITTGYQITAVKLDGASLPIRASNFLSPTEQVLILFSDAERERYLAVPDARLAMSVSASASAGDLAGGADRMRVFALPSGDVVNESTLSNAPTEIIVDSVRFTFVPIRGAVIDASNRPGDVGVVVGGMLTLIGLLGSLLRPDQRMVIYQNAHWTEFYAQGRGVRAVIARLITPPTTPKPEPIIVRTPDGPQA